MYKELFKKIVYYGIATVCLLSGILCLAYYLRSDITVASVAMGIVGLFLIEPAVSSYAKRIRDCFENE